MVDVEHFNVRLPDLREDMMSDEKKTPQSSAPHFLKNRLDG
jgi:hypothetical protein